MRELTIDDMDQASGGILQFIPLAIAVGSTFAKGGTAYFLGGIGIGMAGRGVYSYYFQLK